MAGRHLHKTNTAKQGEITDTKKPKPTRSPSFNAIGERQFELTCPLWSAL
jgi:hypothetical protein